MFSNPQIRVRVNDGTTDNYQNIIVRGVGTVIRVHRCIVTYQSGTKLWPTRDRDREREERLVFCAVTVSRRFRFRGSFRFYVGHRGFLGFFGIFALAHGDDPFQLGRRLRVTQYYYVWTAFPVLPNTCPKLSPYVGTLSFYGA